MAKLEEKLFSVMERNAELQEENARLREENRQLREENARLHDQVLRLKQQLAAGRKDSSTSSKPPSSEMVKPKKLPATGGKKRKKGGQPGHEQHVRSPFPLEAVDHFEPHTLDCWGGLGGRLVLSRCEPEVLQQVEITQTPTVVTEHQGLAYWCPHCRKVHYAPLPKAKYAQNLAKRFLENGETHFRFVTAGGDRADEQSGGARGGTRRFGLWSSTGRSRREREARKAAGGVSGSGH